jgi:hypothetical protein
MRLVIVTPGSAIFPAPAPLRPDADGISAVNSETEVAAKRQPVYRPRRKIGITGTSES